LLLAQELLEQPKMSNHARGLWGYTGRTPSGLELTIQATGMGGPSAAIVLADLAKLGVKRAVRVGTCHGLGDRAQPGELLLVHEALAGGGSAAAFGISEGDAVAPDPELLTNLREQLGDDANEAVVVSLDAFHHDEEAQSADAVGADLQTVAILARARQLDIAAAAILIVADSLSDNQLESAARQAGSAASKSLSR
jgi:uridine phosphorylase